MTNEPPNTEPSLARRLAAAHYARTPEVGACMNWSFDEPNPLVLSLVGGGNREQFNVSAVVAQCFMIFHAGRERVNYGGRSNIGTALKTLGFSQPRTRHLFQRLLTASTLPELQGVLVQIIRSIKPLNQEKPWQCPNWDILRRDLERWCDPATRNDVRHEWGRSFMTYHPPAATKTTNEEKEEN